jgi:hypothetical protein
MAAHKGAAGGNKYESEAQVNASREALQPFACLDELVVAQVRALWWRQLRLGNRLPAQTGMIVLNGGWR